MVVPPAKSQISLGIRRADAQADMSLRWAHSHFVGFVMLWLILTRHKTNHHAVSHSRTEDSRKKTRIRSLVKTL